MISSSATTAAAALSAWRQGLGAVPLLSTGNVAGVPWIVTTPLKLGGGVMESLRRIGDEVLEFLACCWRLRDATRVRAEFLRSLTAREAAGVQRFAGHCRFPVLIRPDIVVDEDGALWIIELDLVPSGAGMLQRLQELHGLGPDIASVWAATVDQPVVLSIPGWKIFAPEQAYFADSVSRRGRELSFVTIEDWPAAVPEGRIVFKNCCTISLMSEDYPLRIPTGAQLCPPPLLDWKGWLALARRMPELRDSMLARRIPESHLLPLDGAGGADDDAVALRKRFAGLSRAQRADWILKPVTEWGARGFREARHISTREWEDGFLVRNPGLLLQRKIESRRYRVEGLAPSGEFRVHEDLRIRLSPYYLVWGDRVEFCGALVCLRPSIKVHGASDALITLAVE